MLVTYKITTDVMNKTVAPVIDAVQGEVNTREIEVEILADGIPLSIPENSSVYVRFRKSDCTGGMYDVLPDGTKAYKIDGNVISVKLAPQMLSASGMVLAQLEIVSDDAILATFSFKVRVEPDPSASVAKSEDYFNWYGWAADELNNHYRDLLDDLQRRVDAGEFKGEQGPQGERGERGPAGSLVEVETVTDEASALALSAPSYAVYNNWNTDFTEYEGTKTLGLYSLPAPYKRYQFLAQGNSALSGMIVRRIDVETNHPEPWEWINPPMESGIEYRTIERFNGMPVYKYCSTLTANAGEEVTFIPPVDNAVIIGYCGHDADWYPLGFEDRHTVELQRNDTFKTNFVNVTSTANTSITVELSYIKLEE